MTQKWHKGGNAMTDSHEKTRLLNKSGFSI